MADVLTPLFDEYAIPTHLRAGLQRYLLHGVRPGSFLCAVLTNDLRDAVLRAADPETLAAIPQIVKLLVHDAPGTASGSPAIVDAWIALDEAVRPRLPNDLGRFARTVVDAETLKALRVEVARGATTHECDEWLDSARRCQLCDRLVDPVTPEPIDALERALAVFIRARMPWAYEDVDRDGGEARDTALAIAKVPAAIIRAEFSAMREDQRAQPRVDVVEAHR